MRSTSEARSTAADPTVNAGPLRLVLGLGLVLAVGLVGCDSSPKVDPSGRAVATEAAIATAPADAPRSAGASPASGPAVPPTTLNPAAADDSADARRLIESADLADETSLDEIGGLRFTPAGARAAADVLASSSDDNAIWAAIWVYGSSGRDPAPLRRHLDSADASIAAMAAATVVAFGDAGGFVALARSLTSADQLRGSRPPLTISDYAKTTLRRYVPTILDQSPPDPTATPAAQAAQWAAWLDAHAASLAFDDASGTWTVR